MRDIGNNSATHQDVEEFIAFRIGSQTYCIDIMVVREIRGWTPATILPHSPDFICGVINLRGAVLPVVNLAARLGFPTSEPTARHAVIVVNIGNQVAGLLVDAVSDILNVMPDIIQPAPDVVISAVEQNFIRGVIATDTRMSIVLATESLLPETFKCCSPRPQAAA